MAFDYKRIMAHTFSVCTPTPVAQVCYNIDNKENYFSYHINTPFISYTYTPSTSIDPCTTTYLPDKIITICPDVTYTTYLPNTPNIQNIQDRLGMIDNILKNTQNEANQCLKQMDYIIGIGSGDGYGVNNISNNDIATNAFTNITVTQHNTNVHETLINTDGHNIDGQLLCKSCGAKWIKNYLLQKEIYWCGMCVCSHVFSPFSIFDFAPFENMEKLKSFEEKLKKKQNDIYNSNHGYFIN